MKKMILLGSSALLVCASLSSCYRTRCEVWEDTKTCGRYVEKGLRSLFGQHLDSREYAAYYQNWDDAEIYSENENAFVPLADAQTEMAQELEVHNYPMAKESPGDPGSKIPGIDGFVEPSGELAKLFKKVHFATDSYTIQGGEMVSTLRTIASYLTQHPETYVFIEGHADERGTAAYNLALSSRRANAVRGFLIDNGVNANQLFTISYGLERPFALGHDENSWQQNRRAQFRLYER